VSDAPVTTEIHQPLDIHRNFPSQVTLDHETCDSVPEPRNFGLGQILHEH
jgi:hypothetical protein